MTVSIREQANGNATRPSVWVDPDESRARQKLDNNNPLGSVIGNAFTAHESVKARDSLLLLAGNES